MSHRNEPARQRHRRTLGRPSVTSLPLDPKPKELNLKNHFGWVTVQKCQVGDGNIPQYPQIVQYHENPEREGPEYKKLTYILYLKGQPDSLGSQEKEIQTTGQRDVTVIPPPKVSKPAKTKDKVPAAKTSAEKAPPAKTSAEKAPPAKTSRPKTPPSKSPAKTREKSPKGKQQVVEITEKKETVRKEEVKLSPSMESKRRRLIDSFYYKKREGDVFRPIDNEASPEGNPVVVENYTTDYVPDSKKKKAEKGRGSPKSWQLRSEAGADSVGSFVVHHIGEVRESDEDMYVMTGSQWDTKYQLLRERERSRSRSERDNQYLYLSRNVNKPRAPRDCS